MQVSADKEIADVQAGFRRGVGRIFRQTPDLQPVYFWFKKQEKPHHLDISCRQFIGQIMEHFREYGVEWTQHLLIRTSI